MRKLIAMFVIALILSLPIYSAAVFASSVTVHSFSVKGKDGVEGFRRPIDHLDIEVVVSIGDDEDLTNNVYYGNVGAFDCEGSESIADAFTCKYKDLETEVAKVKKEHQFSINFYTDEKPKPNPPEETRELAYIVDGLVPKVIEFDIEPKLTNTGKFKVEYLIEDRAYRESTKCSGIDRLEIYDEKHIGEPIEKVPIDTAQCVKDGSKEIELKDKTGKVTLCAKAYDKFGQNPEEFDLCREVTIDKDEVKFVENSESLVDEDKLALTNFKDKSIKAEFSINISGEDLVEGTVVGDFSALNNEEGYNELKAERCYQIKKGIRICEWSLYVKLNKDEAGEKDVVIKAKDEAGNEATKPITYNLQYDGVGPEVLSLKNDYEIDGKFYANAKDNTFTAEIKEDGAGLREEDVILHIGAQAKEATKCEKTTNVCKWEKVSVPGSGVVKAYISTDSKDRLGNSFQERVEQEIIVDNTKPRVIDITITPLRGEATAEVIRTGVSLGITAKLEEGNGIKATADLSKIITGETNFETECNLEEGYWVCEWITKQIDIQDHINDNLVFTFTDYAGNKIKESYPIEVYGVVEEGVIGDFYELEIDEKYLIAIDKETLINLLSEKYSEVVPIKLKYNGKCDAGDVEVLNLRVEGSGVCSDVFTSYNQDKNKKDYNGFLEFLIEKSYVQDSFTELEIGTKEQPCTLKFNVRCGNNVYKILESEEISITIPLVSELTPAESLEDEINKIKEEVEDTGWIDSLDTLFVHLQAVCRIKQSFSSVITAVTIVGWLFNICIDIPYLRELSLYTCQAGKEGAHKTLIAAQESTEGIIGKINWFCGVIQCSDYDEEGKPITVVDPKEGKNYFTKWLGGGYCDWLKEQISWQLVSSRIYEEHPEGAGLIDGFTKTPTLELAKKSWIFSGFCGCVPGLVYNAKKYRQTKCWYGYCLKYLVPAGFPKKECEKQKEYQECVYTRGWFTVYLDMLAVPFKNIMTALEHPIASGWVGLRLYLKNLCKESSGCTPGSCTLQFTGSCGAYATMLGLESIAEIKNALGTENYFQWKPPEIDYCKKFLEEDEEESS